MIDDLVLADTIEMHSIFLFGDTSVYTVKLFRCQTEKFFKLWILFWCCPKALFACALHLCGSVPIDVAIAIWLESNFSGIVLCVCVAHKYYVSGNLQLLLCAHHQIDGYKSVCILNSICYGTKVPHRYA